jgi:glycosyltransferase involved in cell wall biosynthesis
VKRSYPLAIAIPARNEAALAARCLNAIARQIGVDFGDFTVVLLANNCRDDTASIVRRLTLPFRIFVKEVTLPAAQAHAGGARRAAMAEAASLAPDGIIMSTDADCVADDDWMAAMTTEFYQGADAVAGRVSGDWNELQHQPQSALSLGALEWEYLALIAEVTHTLDPLDHDPWPRHIQRCGANFGIRTSMFRSVGGVPSLPTGEDRALFQVVEALDGVVRHAVAPHVTASARMAGRASGGMADTLVARASGHYWCDELLEPADDLIRRCTLRHAARASWKHGDFSSFVEANNLAYSTQFDYFGQAWLDLETHNSCLNKRRVHSETLATNSETLKQFLRLSRYA